MFDMSGKRVIVTGGSRGIGAQIARNFSEAGAKVAIVARTPETVEKAAADMNVRGIACDVSDENAVAESFPAVIEEWGGVDVLINNAGITRDKLLMQMKGDDWDQVMQANLRSCFVCSRAVMRPMLKARGGRIINITSVVGIFGNPGQSNYSASKAGIIGFTKSLAKELATRNVTVNAVAPGFIETEMTDALTDEQREAISSRIPLARLGSSADIAAACRYLASDAAGYVTGEVLRVDGGLAM